MALKAAATSDVHGIDGTVGFRSTFCVTLCSTCSSSRSSRSSSSRSSSSSTSRSSSSDSSSSSSISKALPVEPSAVMVVFGFWPKLDVDSFR